MSYENRVSSFDYYIFQTIFFACRIMLQTEIALQHNPAGIKEFMLFVISCIGFTKALYGGISTASLPT